MTVWLASLACLLLATASVRADRVPANCTGSGLGINLFTSIPDVHVGDTLRYSINVFNGIPNSGRVVCDATNITAFIVTPDGVTHPIALVRTLLHQGESDFYPDVVSYVVRAQDIQPDGTLLATARDTGTIKQNDTDSTGGGFQGVNTEVNLPCVLISAFCLPGVGENGMITISGTVTNCGNNTLVGVVVTNFHDGGFFTVVFTNNLARGQVASFTGSYIPLNPCAPSTAILTVRATDEFTATPRTVTNSTTVVCQNSITPAIQVTKVCPPGPVAPGQLLTFTGTVRNTGNVTLNNVAVVNNQPSANTAVFNVASLAPGEVVGFSGSYLAPTNCSVSDTLTATATSRCGTAVSSTASATCAILTTPGIVVTATCPATPVVAGGNVTYSGTVRNSGDITLNNVVVTSDLPAANTTVFSVASLAPGAVANFTTTFAVPASACAVTATFQGTGRDACTLNSVTNIVSTTCFGTTAPAIAVTLVCPVTTASAGGAITYTGTVRNTGNVQLNNVNVVSGQAVPSTVLTVASLAPGAFANFTVTFTAPADACAVTSTVTATGNDNCSGSPVSNNASATCALVTSPALTLTQACPALPAVPGGPLNYTGTVRNSGNVTLTNVVVLNNLSGSTPLVTIPVLAPGAVVAFSGTYTAPTACTSTSTSTATGGSICGVVISGSVNSTCPILTTPGIVVTATCPAAPITPGGSLTYSGTVRNTGDITLNNVVVTSDLPAANTTVFSVASLAPGAVMNFTTTFAVPANACGVTTTFQGTGQDICTLNSVTNFVSTTCAGITAPAITVTLACPAAAASSGGPITYSGTVRNTGNVTLNNVFVVNSQPTNNAPVIGPITLAPGGSANFTTTFTAPADACAVSSLVTASGNDNCSGALVAANAAATCPLLTNPALALTQTCPVLSAVPGGPLSYTGTVRNSGNVTLTNVVVLNNLSGSTPLVTIPVLAPGAVVAFSGSYTAPTACASTSTSTATGGSICGVVISGSVNSTCPILTTPGIVVTATCPAAPITPGGSLTYTGTVRNTGDITLNNVVVTSDLPAANTTVFSVASLAPGAVMNFTTTFAVPANACAVTTTFQGTGQDICTLNSVTNFVSTTCAALTAPAIAVTLACPAIPVTSGGAITYSGTVRNTGNVTLNNVFVVNSQPTNNAPVIGPITLAPGGSANFTTTFTAPLDACTVTSVVTASGNDNCSGNLVANTAAATCTLVTTPGIVITQACPATPTVPGALVIYTGTVRNNGNITLTNVVVLNDQSGPTPVLTVATLAPNEVVAFSGSYVAPTACTTTSTSTVTGRSICGVAVSHSTSAPCPILTTPAIVVTQTCPATPAVQGGLLTYSGTVSNAGNITLTGVVVTSDRPGANTVIFTQASLAPGAVGTFTGSYQVPTNCCVVSSTVRASGLGCAGEMVTDSATRTCPVLTTPLIVVTKICVPGPLRVGDLMTYSGTVSNAGNITLINVTVVHAQPVNATVLGPLTLAPGEALNYTVSYVVPPDFCGADTVTATGLNVCTLAPVVSSLTTTCPVITPPLIAVTKDCPAEPTPRGGLYIYTGTVSNPGLVTLVNVFVVDNRPTNATPIIGPITLAPGASVRFTNSYTAPHCCCFILDTLTARGQDRCLGSSVTATVTTVCPLLSSPNLAITKVCPPTPVPPGGTYTFTGSITNLGDIVLTNVVVFTSQPNGGMTLLGPIELAPGESKQYSGSYIVAPNTDPATNAVTVRGTDTCRGQTATAMADCAGPVNGLVITAVTLANGTATVSWASTAGVTYRLQSRTNAQNSPWTDTPGDVAGTGGTASKSSPVASDKKTFYRVMIVQ